MSVDSSQRDPQDIVAIFHVSFHPTKGNVIDWALKANDDLNLDGLEFNALPSGLHLVEQDVVHFTKDNQHGVCVYRRRKSSEQGHRGARLSSLGILLAKSARPKPWRHLPALKDVISTIYSRLENSEVLQPSDDDWEPARAFFEQRKVKRADLGGAGDWDSWSTELDGLNDLVPEPMLHLPHLLRILGPSSMTLYKHVLGRKRILIYTLPPVQAACILCHVAAGMCYEDQVETVGESGARLKGRCKEAVNVLGMVTLIDIDRLEAEGKTGRGWIACTSDAIFLEKPSYYDLLIDLTTSTPNKATRPSFSVSQPIPQPTSYQTHRLATTRFAWSDVKLVCHCSILNLHLVDVLQWNELDRILQLDNSCCDHGGSCCPPSSDYPKSKFVNAWTDVWRVYEDVCVICAGLWMGSWRGNSAMSYSTANGEWGSVRLEGDDDLSLNAVTSPGGHVRSLGNGIEGRPLTTKTMRRSSAMSWSSRATMTNTPTTADGKKPKASISETVPEQVDEERRDRQLLTTLALLQTFHAHTLFQLSTLESFLPPAADARPSAVVTLTSKEVLMFELGPFSSLDVKYLDWIAREYGNGVQLVVKRHWKDLFGIVFGYG
ncbi:hypothetical protein C8J56DRAFT_1005133 [Mycena floridula]|nr:hypothetical protein C8J56DRAFT_1005133 [Mycena floridula]